MERRNFIRLSSLAGVSMFFPALLGCPGNTVRNILNTILDSTTAILRVAEPDAPWVADFVKAVNALKTAEASWSSGSPNAVLRDALDALMAVVAVIPLTAPYAPLIDILVAGIEAVISALGPQSGGIASANATVMNPHSGRVVLKSSALQTKVGAYKQQWNEAVKQNPALAPAKLR